MSEENNEAVCPYASPDANHPRHYGVTNVVGSFGQQRFHMPFSSEAEHQAQAQVLEDENNEPLNAASNAASNAAANNAALVQPEEPGDAAILEEGLFAPSEPVREEHEREELLHLSANKPNYGATTSSSRRSTSNSCQSVHPALGHEIPHTTWLFELKLLVVNSAPLAVTFFLQYSLIMASFFNVGHLGTVELGAVSLGAMTSSITGIAFVQGMSTCLDTLCSQAFGAGRPDLVGLYFQKGVLLVLLGLFPIMVLWFNAGSILKYVVAEEESTPELLSLTTQYLRVMIFAMPGYTLFECGKRFLQAQSIFHASTIILVVCAPLNLVLTYTLVWHKTLGIGFLGAPLAVAITDTLLAVFFCAYVLFVDGKRCWTPLSWKVFTNWKPLINLAIPGLVMIESEFLAFEVITLASSYLGTTALAVQTILSSIISLAYEIPFAVSCAASSRVATLIGSGLPAAARTAAKVAAFLGVCIGALDVAVILTFRKQLTGIFSTDQNVVDMASQYIYLCAIMHLFDATAAVLAGVLRGQGRQRIGGYINLLCYYLIGVPAGFLLCFHFKLGLQGIWIGFNTGILIVVLSSLMALRASNWSHYVRVAHSRES